MSDSPQEIQASVLGLTTRDIYFVMVVVALILMSITILISDPERPAFDLTSIQKPFLTTLSLAVLSALVLGSFYIYQLRHNASFVFISLCWLANLVYILCSMVESTDQQRYVTFIVALIADIPLFLSAFTQEQRKWWFLIPPLIVILFCAVFYSINPQIPFESRLNILYVIGPLSSATFLFFKGYSVLVIKKVFEPTIRHARIYGFSFLSLSLLQLPFSYHSLCFFYPTLVGCQYATAFLGIAKIGILASKIVILCVLFFIVRDSLQGLRSAEEQLKIKGEFEELGYFAASLEHELRNPLVVVGEQIDYFKKKTQTDDELQGRFETLERQLNRISRAADIINVLRSKRADIIKKLKPVAVVGGVNQAIKDVKKEFSSEAANTYFDVIDHSNQASIEADPALFEQCLVNIFKNSLEAIKRAARTGKIVVDITLKGNEMVAISVIDNGDGFVEEDIPLLTNPGYTKKAKSSTKSNRGLGLFVCSKIVELHEGKLAFTNLNASGADVTVEFTRYISKRLSKRQRKAAGGGENVRSKNESITNSL